MPCQERNLRLLLRQGAFGPAVALMQTALQLGLRQLAGGAWASGST